MDKADSMGGELIDTAMITITVNEQPNITGRDTTVCMDATIDLESLVSGTPSNTLEFGENFGTYGDVAMPNNLLASATNTYYVRDSFTNTGCVDTAEINVTVLSSMACLMNFSSINLMFNDPCDCDQVVKFEGLFYLRDTQLVTTEEPVSNVNFYAAGSADFYQTPGVEMPDGEPFIQVSPTMYKLEFFKLSNVQAVGFVTANDSDVPVMIPEAALEFCFVNLDCPALIPTLGQWGIILLSILLLIVGVVGVRQRKVLLG